MHSCHSFEEEVVSDHQGLEPVHQVMLFSWVIVNGSEISGTPPFFEIFFKTNLRVGAGKNTTPNLWKLGDHGHYVLLRVVYMWSENVLFGVEKIHISDNPRPGQEKIQGIGVAVTFSHKIQLFFSV